MHFELDEHQSLTDPCILVILYKIPKTVRLRRGSNYDGEFRMPLVYLGPPRLPPGAPAPPGLRGGESCLYRSPAAAHPARLRAGAKWSVRLLQPAARTQRAGGTKHSSRRAVAQPAPHFAIRPRRRGGGGSAGFHPPRPREAARRLQRPAQAARRHGTAASPDRGSLPPAAASGPTPSPAGSGPEPPR